jgi:hypothetical protein
VLEPAHRDVPARHRPGHRRLARGRRHPALRVAPVAAIGAVIAADHVAPQRLPDLPSGACSLDVPCRAVYVERFGFVTIPVMALVAFLAILTLLLGLVPSGGDCQIQEPPLS